MVAAISKPLVLRNSVTVLVRVPQMLMADQSCHLSSQVNRTFRHTVRSSFLFCKQQLLLAKINHLIYFSQSQLLLTYTNVDRTTSRKALYEKKYPKSDEHKLFIAIIINDKFSKVF